MKLPYNVEYILNKLEGCGYECYIVGGCVRDYIMGIEPHDYDITTSALPEDVKKIFNRTVDTGIKHGTVTVVLDKKGYEVTTYRIDGEYKDSRHPESVIFTDRLAGDLSRRDFTVNAIAYNNKRGFVDMFDGMGDIEKRIIRGVGDPDKRFKEDALRMMRALRFSAQLNFTIEEHTMQALKQNAPLIKNISAERVREELFRLIASDHCERLELLKSSGMAEYILPEIFEVKADFKKTGSLMPNIPLRLSYLFYEIGEKRAEKMLRRLKSDGKTIATTVLLIKNAHMEISDEYSMRKLISRAGESSELLIELICSISNTDRTRADVLYNSVKNDCCSLKDMAVTGIDLTRMGIHGKEVGILLNKALDMVMKSPDKNNRDTLIQYIKENVQ